MGMNNAPWLDSKELNLQRALYHVTLRGDRKADIY